MKGREQDSQEGDEENSITDLLAQPKSFSGKREHLRRFVDSLGEQDQKSWNQWRKKYPNVRPDLRGLDLTIQNIRGINLHRMNLGWARLEGAQLQALTSWEVNFADADLRWANLDGADLSLSVFDRANLQYSRFIKAILTDVSARKADFRHANLSHAVLNGAHLEGAKLRGARVVGISTWEIEVDGDTDQRELILEELGDFIEDWVDETDQGYKERVIGRVDHLEAVQLLYLLRNKHKLKTVIDAVTSNLVLILGNFSEERMKILRSVEMKLAQLRYAPVIFDFEMPSDRDLIETVSLLANLSCFLIVDLTEPASTPLETMLIAPQIGVPLAPIIQKGERPFSLFNSLQAKYWWVLPTWTYRNEKNLINNLETEIVDKCEKKRKLLRRRRHAELHRLASPSLH
jgi:uncharacterized protein YjbI with pentapeptide repeats